MKLVIDKFKTSGKWSEEDSVDLTDNDLKDLESWEPTVCLDLFNNTTSQPPRL